MNCEGCGFSDFQLVDVNLKTLENDLIEINQCRKCGRYNFLYGDGKK